MNTRLENGFYKCDFSVSPRCECIRFMGLCDTCLAENKWNFGRTSLHPSEFQTNGKLVTSTQSRFELPNFLWIQDKYFDHAMLDRNRMLLETSKTFEQQRLEKGFDKEPPERSCAVQSIDNCTVLATINDSYDKNLGGSHSIENLAEISVEWIEEKHDILPFSNESATQLNGQSTGLEIFQHPSPEITVTPNITPPTEDFHTVSSEIDESTPSTKKRVQKEERKRSEAQCEDATDLNKIVDEIVVNLVS